MISTLRTGRRSWSPWARWTLFAFAVASASTLAIASRLEPDPRGHGTHEQLGLAPCAFRTLTGRPCPTCGMTTAFAWTMRGRWSEAWRANPAGCGLAIFVGPIAVWLASCAGAGRPLVVRDFGRALGGLVFAAVGLTMAVWLLRMAWLWA